MQPKYGSTNFTNNTNNTKRVELDFRFLQGQAKHSPQRGETFIELIRTLPPRTVGAKRDWAECFPARCAPTERAISVDRSRL